MREYKEKRDFPRMSVNCPAQIRIKGMSDVPAALVKELSGNGLLLWMEGSAEPGDEFEITIPPGTDLTPPLNAKVQVVRCTPIEGTNSCALACRMVELH